jgi:hypothetical protein
MVVLMRREQRRMRSSRSASRFINSGANIIARCSDVSVVAEDEATCRKR